MNRVYQVPRTKLAKLDDGYSLICSACCKRHGPKLTGPRVLEFRICMSCDKTGKTNSRASYTERRRRGKPVESVEKFR